jgi:hypothetical protein
VAEWSIQPRTAALVRGSDPVRFWSSLIVVERHNVDGAAPGTWQVEARNEGLAGLLSAGSGAILFRDGVRIMSGPVTSIKRGANVSTVSGIADTDCLSDRILFPEPSKAITAQTVAYDNRSGPAESVLLAYIDANAGPGARPERRIPGLRVPVSAGRGKATVVTGRLTSLGEAVADVAEGGGLHVEVLHNEDAVGPFLEVLVRPVADRSANVRFGTFGSFTGGLVGEDWSYTLSRPTVTDAIVAGGGQGVARTFVQRTTPAAESLWAAKVETLIDQRQTVDTAELVQAGDEALLGGANPVSVSFTVIDSPDVRYRRDWSVGDIVGVSVDGIDLVAPVREVTTTVSGSSGSPSETISAMVGSRDSSAWVTKTNADAAKALRRIAQLQAT